MKFGKVFTRLTVICLCILMLPVLPAASGFSAAFAALAEEGVTWELDEDGLLTVRGTGEIPSDFRSTAPLGMIRRLVIEEGVTGIPKYCFQNSNNMQSVSLPESLLRIGEYAFYGCGSLKSFTVPAGVQTLGDRILKGCYSLEELTLPFVGLSADPAANGVIYPFGALFDVEFSGAKSSSDRWTDEVTQRVVNLGADGKPVSYWKYTFCLPISLKSVTVTGGTVYANAFSVESQAMGWHWITELIDTLTFGENVQKIETGAVSDAFRFRNINVTGSDTVAENGCFNVNPDCGITSLTVPGELSCSHIGSLFRCLYSYSGSEPNYRYGCPESLKELHVVGSAVKGGLFTDCAFTKITLAPSVASIGDGAFAGSTGLAGLILPAALTRLGESAFQGCTDLTLAGAMPEGLTEIGASAFSGCTALKALPFPAALRTVGSCAFENCTGLTEIALNDGLEEIGDGAFRGCCALTAVSVPATVTALGGEAFKDCSLLAEAVLNGAPVCGNAVFENCAALDSFRIPEGMTELPYRFCANSGLKEIYVPLSVAEFKDAFYGCSGLTDVYYAGTYDQWDQIPGNYFYGISTAFIHTVSEHTHAYGEGTVSRLPTCTAEGSVQYVCTVCRTVKTQALPVSARHLWGPAQTTPAACRKDGVTRYVCLNCGAEESKVLPASGAHQWDACVPGVKATCAREGTVVYTCLSCGETRAETIPKTGVHTWDGGKVTKEPSVGVPGEKTYTCAVCSATRTEALPALPAPETVRMLLGDADLNGKVSTGDARVVLRAAIGLEKLSETQKLAADLQEDGVITTGDARMVLRTAIGLEEYRWVEAPAKEASSVRGAAVRRFASAADAAPDGAGDVYAFLRGLAAAGQDTGGYRARYADADWTVSYHAGEALSYCIQRAQTENGEPVCFSLSFSESGAEAYAYLRYPADGSYAENTYFVLPKTFTQQSYEKALFSVDRGAGGSIKEFLASKTRAAEGVEAALAFLAAAAKENGFTEDPVAGIGFVNAYEGERWINEDEVNRSAFDLLFRELGRFPTADFAYLVGSVYFENYGSGSLRYQRHGVLLKWQPNSASAAGPYRITGTMQNGAVYYTWNLDPAQLYGEIPDTALQVSPYRAEVFEEQKELLRSVFLEMIGGELELLFAAAGLTTMDLGFPYMVASMHHTGAHLTPGRVLEVLREATCVSAGLAAKKCEICLETVQTVIPATGKHVFEILSVEGEIEHVRCVVCGVKMDRQKVSLSAAANELRTFIQTRGAQQSTGVWAYGELTDGKTVALMYDEKASEPISVGMTETVNGKSVSTVLMFSPRLGTALLVVDHRDAGYKATYLVEQSLLTPNTPENALTTILFEGSSGYADSAKRAAGAGAALLVAWLRDLIRREDLSVSISKDMGFTGMG